MRIDMWQGIWAKLRLIRTLPPLFANIDRIHSGSTPITSHRLPPVNALFECDQLRQTTS